MPTRPPILLAALAVLVISHPAHAQHDVYFRGKVVLEDGSLPSRSVTVQRVCAGLQQPVREGVTSRKTGEYVIRLFVNQLDQVFTGTGAFALMPCSLEAADSGYVSSRIDLTDRRITLNPQLPDLVLTRRSHTVDLAPRAAGAVPRRASKYWKLAVNRLTTRDWAGAEAPLRSVVGTAPRFAPAWAALGNVCARLGRIEEARRALERAVELNAKDLSSYQVLAQIQFDMKDWHAVVTTTGKLIAVDSKHVYVEAYLTAAAALYQLREYDQALGRIDTAVRLDRLRELKRAEYIRGLVLEAKGDHAGAGKSLTSYLSENPHAKDAAAVRERIANLGKGPPADLSAELTSLDLRMAATGEAAVPGGIKAFSIIAQLSGTPSPHDFFLEYARAITAGRFDQPNRTREAGNEVRAFIATVAALERLGERTERGTMIRISTASDTAIRKSRAILSELGWKLVSKSDGYSIEATGRYDDALRQRAMTGLGVDEIDMRGALGERREFAFEIPRETARLVGGASWSLLLKGVPEVSGGPAEIFIRDWRFARVYSGLGAMDGESAATLVSAVGLADLIVKYSGLTAEYAKALAIDGGRVSVPGGVKADPVWTHLVGASPQAVAPFLNAILAKDQGRLLAFFSDLSDADAAHQRFFTQTSERADAFYRWYRDSIPPPGSMVASRTWHPAILQSLRMDDSGKVRFPGGREAWGPASETDDEILLRRAPLEALAAVTLLEQHRGAPLSRPAAELLVRRYGEWRNLFGYFERLPGLDAPEFRALEEFAAAAGAVPISERNLLLGEWHSLVKLILLGRQAGSLTAGEAAHAFRVTCSTLRPPDPSAAALATVRLMSGGAADLDEWLAVGLLRLDRPRYDAFQEIRKLQNVPGLRRAASSAAGMLEALSGAAYAAMLDPRYLLVAADRQLLRKHRFVTDSSGGDLFPESALVVSNGPSGSHFEGGFATFEEAAEPLRARTGGIPIREPEASTTALNPAADPLLPAPAAPDTAPPGGRDDVVFRATGRLVEVYATVTDNRGRYVDNLTASQFSVLEESEAKPVQAFESHMAGVSVALVFDTSASMIPTLPQLKRSALQLLGELRPVDSAAVYAFNDTASAIVPFTEDKEAVKRAVVKLHASGVTSLYEALVRVDHDLASRGGKKVIVVFSDGGDNSSMLSSQLAIESAKQRGVPIYTIAQGEALLFPKLVAELDRIARATGGTPFRIHSPREIAEVFARISQDLMHGYLLVFQPSPGENRAWRNIKVVLDDAKGLHVRAREGYYAE